MQTIYSDVKWSAIESAATLCRTHTLADPLKARREYGTILHHNTGEVIAEVQGDLHSVNFAPVASKVIGNIVVHSHPDATPLSPQDITMGTNSARLVVAVGTDGSIYRSSGWNTDKIINPAHANFLEKAVVDPRIKFIYHEGNGAFTRTESTFIGLHATYLEWERKGWLTYSATLTPDAQCVWEHGRDFLLSHGADGVL